MHIYDLKTDKYTKFDFSLSLNNTGISSKTIFCNDKNLYILTCCKDKTKKSTAEVFKLDIEKKSVEYLFNVNDYFSEFHADCPSLNPINIVDKKLLLPNSLMNKFIDINTGKELIIN